MEWLLAIALKPFILLVVFGLIVIPLEILLRPYLPPLFTNRTFIHREPLKYMIVWLALMIALWTWIGSLISRGW